MQFPDINNLLSFLRLDKEKMHLEKISMTSNNFGLQRVELEYYDIKTKELKKCIIGVNGVRNALTPG